MSIGKNGLDRYAINLHSFGQQGKTVFPHQNFIGGNENIYEDFPYIDLGSLCVATKNFSDSNKLGQGGFGPVYKVVIELKLIHY